MTDKQIIINDYFNIMRDENGRIFGIQEIGDIRQLIKDIREQNEYIQAKEQECETLVSQLDFEVQKKECLEQECEKLKSDLTDLSKIIDCKNGTILTFKQQLDQLKVENDTLRQFLSKEPLALQALQSGYASYKKSSDVFYEMVKQYKQALTEIKEIAEEEVHTRMLFADKKSFCDFNKILQKISEVQND